MTSAEFRSVSIDEIIVSPDRQRKELRDDELAALAQSIQNIGLINPLVIDDDNTLVAGERRLRACRMLGWTAVPVQLSGSLSEEQLHLIELEENVKRSNLTWRERLDATLEYVKIRRQQDNSSTTGQLAEELGITAGHLGKFLLIGDEISRGNRLVLEADKLSVAYNVSNRAKERREQAAVERLVGGVSEETPEATVAGVPDSDTTYEPEEPAKTNSTPLLNLDFVEWSQEYTGQRFNFIHCDFPYGVGADKAPQGASDKYGKYDDSAGTFFRLLEHLGDVTPIIAADECHLIFWFDMRYYDYTRDTLIKYGWSVQDHPLIWHKDDNTGILPDPSRGPRRIYETAFFASRGDRKIVQAVGNVFACGVDKTNRIHMSEKPRLMLEHFFRMCVDSSTVMLDPTCGSGNAVKAAEDMGAERVMGLEVDVEFHKLAVERYHD